MSWTLLIVEDEASISETLCEVLEMRGYRVWCAANGREALDLVRAKGFRPDAILLDMTMPEMDGRSFLAASRFEHLLATSPVIVMTAQRENLELVEGVAFERLMKPTRLETIIGAVERACQVGQGK